MTSTLGRVIYRSACYLIVKFCVVRMQKVTNLQYIPRYLLFPRFCSVYHNICFLIDSSGLLPIFFEKMFGLLKSFLLLSSVSVLFQGKDIVLPLSPMCKEIFVVVLRQIVSAGIQAYLIVLLTYRRGGCRICQVLSGARKSWSAFMKASANLEKNGKRLVQLANMHHFEYDILLCKKKGSKLLPQFPINITGMVMSFL